MTQSNDSPRCRRVGRSSLSFIITCVTLVILHRLSWEESNGGQQIIGPAIFNHEGNIQTNTKNDWDSFSNVRISFSLHDPDDRKFPPPDQYESIKNYLCRDKADLPPTLSGRTILDFTASVSTDLKIVFFGDSIAGQFAQSFDSSVLGFDYEENRSVKRSFLKVGSPNPCLSVSAPTRGGGVSAFWRVTYPMEQGRMSPRVLCSDKMNFIGLDSVFDLLDHQYVDEDINKTKSISVGEFDVAVVRLPYGWVKDIRTFTKELIIEEINLIGQYLGVETVIITTLALSNNVKRPETWESVIKLNQMIRDIAVSWTPGDGGDVNGIKTVLVQEFSNFTNQIIWTNAKHIGYNVSIPDFTKRDGWEHKDAGFLLDRLTGYKFLVPSIPMVCADQATPEKENEPAHCLRNKISPDGGHWCTGTLGPRYSASIACLAGCVYNGNGLKHLDNETVSSSPLKLRKCEQACNDQFMSLVPIDEKWIENEATIFSSSG